MTVELRPFGVRCNISCRYCYQDNQRQANDVSREYDLDVMKNAIEEQGGPFTLFGGEPLLMPLRDLEELWSWGLEKFGTNSLQTNGTLIKESHIRLFKKYQVQVGISIDGPDDLNDLRWVRSRESTRKVTSKTESAIRRLCSAGITPSLIITLHRINADAKNLPRLLAWVRQMDDLGISSVRLHLLESESAAIRESYALSTDEYISALTAFMRLESKLSTVRFDLFTDMRRMLAGQDNSTSCIWNACDPYTTPAVQGVEGMGQRSTCGRTNKEGIQFLKPDHGGFERYLALYGTPQEYGGCKDCRFFLMCKGNCPGTAEHGDWRQRTEHCDVLKAIFRLVEQQIEEEGGTPLSKHPERKNLETAFIQGWCEGRQPMMRHFVHPEKQEDDEVLDLRGEFEKVKHLLDRVRSRYVSASAE